MMFSNYAGCYIGIAEEGFPIVCDLYSDGKFIMSGVMEGKAFPFALGDYTADGDIFKIPAKKARLMAILNNQETVGKIKAKKCLRFAGAITYYAGDTKRTVFPFSIDDEESPLPDSYSTSVLNSFSMFDMTKYDFGGLDAEEAMDMAGIKTKDAPEDDADDGEEKDFVPTREDSLRLYYKGSKIEGAYFDKKGNICYEEVKPRKFISQDEAAKIGDWTNVSWNIEADTKKEQERVDTINRANKARAAGTFDENKDYSKDD